MSFTVDVKKELCGCDLSKHDEKTVFYGFMYGLNKTRFFTESDEIKSYLMHIAGGENIRFNPAKKLGKDGFEIYFKSVSFDFSQANINQDVANGTDKNTGLFLRGAFLACGIVSDPEKEYHLEFSVGNEKKCDALYRLITESGMKIKKSSRRGKSILYVKESEAVSDILTFIGAMISSMEIMNAKIYKGVRNNVNRTVNCEAANIEKTVAASRRQQEDIAYIEQNGGIGQLPDELKAIAVLRKENVELTLSEIGKMLTPAISRSGVYHRMKRIEGLADRLRKERGE